MTEHKDGLETRDPEQREQALMAALSLQVKRAKRRSPYFKQLFKSINPLDVVNRRALAALPVTRKADLVAAQSAHLPFGEMTTVGSGKLARIFTSPGPVYEPEAHRPDYWRMGRALFAAGFRKGHVIHNSFSYHLTPAGAMFEAGAHALGCAVVPGGVGQTELQLRAIADIRPDGYVGTPSFLGILVGRAAETGAGIESMKRALVSGEALSSALRERFSQCGIEVMQCYGTADIGLIAYESEARNGLILDEQIIVEIVYPGTGMPLGEEGVGEVVVTTLTPEYPLIRFSTGDLSVFVNGRSPCGRTNQRIKGWMGRADQSTKVRGMFVHPLQIEEISRRHAEITAARLFVSRGPQGHDEMVLKVEMRQPAVGTAHINETLHAVTRLRGAVEHVPEGSLPNDGLTIVDARTYD